VNIRDQEKVVVIRNSGTVALSGPTTIDLYRGTFGTRKKVGVIRNSGTVALSEPTTIDLYRGTFGTRKKWS